MDNLRRPIGYRSGMRRTPLTRALAGLAAGVSLVATLSACAAKPQDSNTSNGITPGPPPPSGVKLVTLTPQPTKS
ncbi:MAG: hypothetical protein QOE76_3908 [Frankiales bacterium]|nr:hypothetical protein [Frankiales bacterium]